MSESIKSHRDDAAAARMRERRAGGRRTEASMAALLLVNVEFEPEDTLRLVEALIGSRFSINDLHDLSAILMEFTNVHESPTGSFIGLGRLAREGFESRSRES